VCDPIEQQLAREKALAAQDPTVAQTERLAKAALHAATNLYRSVLKLGTITEALTIRLESLVVSGDLSGIDAVTALAHIKSIARVTRDATMITAKSIETHQLVSGEPTSIVQHIAAPDVPVDLETAKRDAEALLRAVKREEAKKQLAEGELVDGTIN
jgi:hypothetical protein